ncbi:MAG: PilZ domain-containing protein [Pseudomonadales bacterium]
MDKLQIGHVQLELLGSSIVISDHSGSGSGRVILPADRIQEVIEYLNYQVNGKLAEQRRSFRLTLDPGEINAWITAGSQEVTATPLDISLGGALLQVPTSHNKPLGRGDTCVVRLDLDGRVAVLNSEVVRVGVGQLAVRFVDCDIDGSLAPTSELMHLYSEMQRRWLAKRFKS